MKYEVKKMSFELFDNEALNKVFLIKRGIFDY